MVKLIILKKDKKRFQDIFKFWFENCCELALFPEGIKWRNDVANGIIYKNAFFDYPIKRKKILGRFNKLKRKDISAFLKLAFKDIDNTFTEINL